MALLNLSCGSVFLVFRGGTELPPSLSPAAQSLPSERSGGSNLLAAGICAGSRSWCYPEPCGEISWSPAAPSAGGPAAPAVPQTAVGRAGRSWAWIPMGDKGLALLPMNPLSARPPPSKCHPPASPCSARQRRVVWPCCNVRALSQRAGAGCVQAEPPPPCEGEAMAVKAWGAHLARRRRALLCSGLGSREGQPNS